MNIKLLTHPTMKNVRVFVCENYDELSEKASAIVGGAMQQKEGFILGLATGSSPVGLYQGLIKQYENGVLDFSKVKSYNLDEYYPIAPENDQSYVYFMNKNLFDHVNIDKANVHLPDGNAADVEKACSDYEKEISDLGGVDLQVLGIGSNGHIGFNEPCDEFVGPTHVVTLTENTIKDNSRFFASADLVPRKAVSMGIGTIMNAKQIVLVANGKNKADAIKAALEGPVVPAVPASVLQFHQNVTFVLDKDAASKLEIFKEN
jgi:glucosamine-6-phosphate deaminase